MKIVMRDGRVFQGTALQIVKAMQDIAFGVEDFTVPKYIEWVVANARKFEEVELDVKGETDEELAASLVAEMLRHRPHGEGVGRRPPRPTRAERRVFSREVESSDLRLATCANGSLYVLTRRALRTTRHGGRR